jgi:hypothetical protein
LSIQINKNSVPGPTEGLCYPGTEGNILWNSTAVRSVDKAVHLTEEEKANLKYYYIGFNYHTKLSLHFYALTQNENQKLTTSNYELENCRTEK